MNRQIGFQPIGVVRSPVSEPIDENWGGVVSEIRIEHHLAGGLRGIGQFFHLVVVFWMHQTAFNASADLVRRPRGRSDMPEVGIFAQRAKHRPNPIGVTTVRLLEVDGNVLRVQGLDAIDGTPVLDIKPFVPASGSAADRNSCISGWNRIFHPPKKRTLPFAYAIWRGCGNGWRRTGSGYRMTIPCLAPSDFTQRTRSATGWNLSSGRRDR